MLASARCLLALPGAAAPQRRTTEHRPHVVAAAAWPAQNRCCAGAAAGGAVENLTCSLLRRHPWQQTRSPGGKLGGVLEGKGASKRGRGASRGGGGGTPARIRRAGSEGKAWHGHCTGLAAALHFPSPAHPSCPICGWPPPLHAPPQGPAALPAAPPHLTAAHGCTDAQRRIWLSCTHSLLAWQAKSR